MLRGFVFAAFSVLPERKHNVSNFKVHLNVQRFPSINLNIISCQTKKIANVIVVVSVFLSLFFHIYYFFLFSITVPSTVEEPNET